MKLEINIHPVGSTRFFVDYDFTIWSVKIESVNIRVFADDRYEVSHSLEPVEIAEHPPRKIMTRGDLLWTSAMFRNLFETIEDARVDKAEMIAIREARQ